MAGGLALGMMAPPFAQAAPSAGHSSEASSGVDRLADADESGDLAEAPETPASQPLAPEASAPKSSGPESSPLRRSKSQFAPSQPSAQPPAAQPAQPNPNAVALANPLANDFGYSSSPPSYSLASTPNMLGDVLGVKYRFASGGNISIAAGDRGAKIADDSRPLPTDRVFFDYNYFSRANTTANGVVVGLDRYTLGIEKTFLDGCCSIEIKAPLDSGLNSIQDSTASTSSNEGTVFGNLTITPKVLLFQSCGWLASAGVTLDLPTSLAAEHRTAFSTTTFDDQVRDDALHVEPFLGLQVAPNDRLFSITYLQLDVDANGDRVTEQVNSLPPVSRGRLREPTLLYVDFSAGYWLFHDGPCDCGDRILTGLAPVVELHYATALQSAHSVGNIRAVSQRTDILNLTSGAQFELGPCSTLAIGIAVPLRTLDRDKEFNTELIVQFNRRF